jgi:hypothetical protein
LTSQSPSSFSYVKKGDEITITIANVAFEVISPYVPDRQEPRWLALRTTTRSQEVLDQIGTDSTVTLEAWLLGTPLSEKPLYTVTLEAASGAIEGDAVFVFDRGLEEVSWWSAYALDNGSHLFDSYVPVINFTISNEYVIPRFAGLEVPPDDAEDARLKEPHVVGVVSYASSERTLREALLTCDDPKRAAEFRSYWDTHRTLAVQEGPVPVGKDKKPGEPTRTLVVTWAASPPEPPNPVSAQIPISGDDLDLAHAALPPCMRAAAWKR